YFYVLGNSPPGTTTAGTTTPYENGPLQPGTNIPTGSYPTGVTTYTVPPATPPSGAPVPAVIQSLNLGTGFDPLNGTAPTNLKLYPGVLPGIAAASTSTTTPPVTNYLWKIPYPAPVAGGVVPPLYYWACLRRPANPFAAVSQANPM